MTRTSRRQILLTSVPSAVVGYGALSLIAHHLLAYWWGILALVIVIASSELWNRIPEFASLDPEWLCVSRRGIGQGQFRTQEIHIPYDPITGIAQRRREVEVTYRNPNATKRVLGEDRESIRTNVPQEFIDALQPRITTATGVAVPMSVNQH